MRTMLVLGLTLLLSACDAADGADSSEGPTAGNKPAVSATWRGEGTSLEFSAWEMGCGGCESTIQKRLGVLDGVASVNADHKTAVVRVNLADGADRAALTAQIEAALEQPASGKVYEIIRATP